MRESILDEFYEKEVEPRLDEMLEQLEISFQTNRHQWKQQLIPEFQNICRAAKKIQVEKSFPIGFLMIHPLRTRLLNRDYRYQAWIYDEEWYVHEGYPVGEVDVSFLFQYYDELWNQLQTVYSNYWGKVTEMDVEQIMLRLLDDFHVYVNELLRYSTPDAVETEEYLSLERADIFHVECGEMFEPCDVILIEDHKKRLAKVLKWLDKQEEGAYCFADFSGLVMKEIEYQTLDLRYADFRECDLTSSHLNVCMLNGTRFRYANLTHASLMISVIAGADFESANLEHANLSRCVAYMGKKFLNKWKKTGYTETSFRKANLYDVNFENAVLHGADFRGANLTQANFNGASLAGSIFDKSALSQCNFTKEQRKEIIIH